MSSTEKQCNHLLIFSVKFKAIHRNCQKALNNQRCLKQTKAKTKEYQVKLGRLCCGPGGYLFSIATLTHSTGQHHGFAYLGGSSHKNSYSTSCLVQKSEVPTYSKKLR